MPYAKKSDSKKKKKAVMKERMEAFKEGKMHSGKKTGPVVTNPKQAIAIGLSMSGQSNKKSPKKKKSKKKK
jgi:hypothetical protein